MVLVMDAVPVIDVSGLVALETVIEKLQAHGTFVVMAGVQAQPRQALERAGLRESPGKLAICAGDDEALLMVRMFLGISAPVAAAAGTVGP